MALINKDENAQPVGNRSARVITHYININILTEDGKHENVGAVPVYDGGTKIQRTLVKMAEDGIDIAQVAIVMDVRANVKSDALADTSKWAKVSVVETADAE
jgi:hypothetical protein